MDPNRFDTLTRSLTAARSRRAAVGVAIGGALGLLGVHPEQAEAHNPLKECKKKSGKQKKACIKKAKAHNATHTVAAPAPSGTSACTPNCSGGQRCDGGTCICDAQSCTGCCDGASCKGGNADGACGSNGGVCRVCASSETCSGGACANPCRALKADCTNAEQCCQEGGTVECAPTGNLDQNQCCRPRGGACSNPGEFRECCQVVFEGGNGTLVHCAANHTCGGPGAMCFSHSACASGVCCNDMMMGFGVCCAAGKQCVVSEHGFQQCEG